MLQLINVTKTYFAGGQEIPVLKGINIEIKEGELVSLMGASGSGKTTTMNIIGLLDKPSSGQYLLKGREVSTLSDDEQAHVRNQMIGFVFQQFFLLPRLTAIQNVSLPLTYRNLSAAEIKQHAMASLEKVNVAELANRKPSEMSGGQQQRIAIARALVNNPAVILADEPTGALDSKTSQEIMNLLISLNKQEKATIVVVTHDINVAKQCARIIRIVDGNIVADNP